MVGVGVSGFWAGSSWAIFVCDFWEVITFWVFSGTVERLDLWDLRALWVCVTLV